MIQTIVQFDPDCDNRFFSRIKSLCICPARGSRHLSHLWFKQKVWKEQGRCESNKVKKPVNCQLGPQWFSGTLMKKKLHQLLISMHMLSFTFSFFRFLWKIRKILDFHLFLFTLSGATLPQCRYVLLWWARLSCGALVCRLIPLTVWKHCQRDKRLSHWTTGLLKSSSTEVRVGYIKEMTNNVSLNGTDKSLGVVIIWSLCQTQWDHCGLFLNWVMGSAFTL